jgi:hypothetical protein
VVSHGATETQSPRHRRAPGDHWARNGEWGMGDVKRVTTKLRSTRRWVSHGATETQSPRHRRAPGDHWARNGEWGMGDVKRVTTKLRSTRRWVSHGATETQSPRHRRAPGHNWARATSQEQAGGPHHNKRGLEQTTGRGDGRKRVTNPETERVFPDMGISLRKPP